MRRILERLFGAPTSESSAPPLLQARLQSGARELSLRRLRSYGLQSVRVIDAAQLEAIVAEAVAHAQRPPGAFALEHPPSAPAERAEAGAGADPELWAELLALRQRVGETGREPSQAPHREPTAVEPPPCAERADRVERLERRLAKLRLALAERERDLQELRLRAQRDEGVASIYRDVQGLSASDPALEQKGALLAEVFRQNLSLQTPGGVPDAEDRAA